MKLRFLSFLILTILIFSENFWGLNIFGEDMVNENIYLKIALFIIFILYLISNPFKSVKSFNYSKIWIKYFLSIIISFLYGTFYVFKQPITGLINILFFSSGVLLYFFLIRFHSNLRSTVYIFKTLIYFGVFSSLFIIFCSLFQPEIFINDDIYSMKRFGYTRVAGFGENAIVFTLIYSFFKIYFKSNSLEIKYYLYLSIMLITVLFVMISRQIIISLLLLYMLFLVTNILKYKKNLVIIYSIMIISFISLPFLENYLNLFIASIDFNSSKSLDSGSFEIRLLAIAYYFDMFLQTSGIGFGPFQIYDDINRNILSYSTNFLNFRLADLGVFTIIFTYGFYGIYVLLTYLKKSFFLLKFKTFDIFQIEKMTIKYFLIFKILTLNYFFYWSSFACFFAILAYFSESFYYHSERNKNTQSLIEYSK